MQLQVPGTGLIGPYLLAIDVIDREVGGGNAGAYALGYIDNLGRFCITFVGSARTNLQSKLKEHVGTAQYFKFRHLLTERSAFEKECELFHDFLPIGNFLHPSRPTNHDWKCPKCRTMRT